MKKIYLILLSSLMVVAANAQLTGTKNIPGDYATLAAAITDLNTQGVGTGGVIINVLAGNPQSAPVGGLVLGGAGTAILTTTSSTNQVTIIGNGNTVTASTPQASGVLTDAIFKLVGADWVTITGFTMQENASNTTTAAATNNMTEFGVALFYVTLTDGAKNNTIQNNTISLNRAYSNTIGIYSNVRHSSTVVTTAADITTAPGSNSGNKVYSNSISNVDYGIAFIGSSTAVAMDNGNDVGGNSLATGNTLTNWGGLVSGTISGFISLTGSNAGIFMNHQVSENVSFNTLISATNITTLTTTGFLGIFKSYSTGQPTGLTFTSNYNNNTVTLTNAPTTSQMTCIGLQGLTALATATLNCNNNSIINCAVTGAGATSATMLGMLHSSAPGTFNINNNIVRGFTSTATTGSFAGIQQQTNGVVNNLNINNNSIGDATAGAVTFSNTNTGASTGISVTATGATNTCAVSISNNDIRGIVHNVVGSGTQTYISNAAPALSLVVNTNTFTNLTANTTGTVTFVSITYSATLGTQTKTVSGNSIVTGFNRLGASGSVLLVSDNGSSVTGTVSNCTSNNFSNITVAGTTTITGLNYTDGGTAPARTVSGNTLSNWTAVTGTLIGMNFTYWNGNSSLSNNTVSNINGQGSITGINIGATANTANPVNISNNTVARLTSSGTGGAVIGIICSNTSANININNNQVSGLSSTGAVTSSGIVVSGATNTNVFRNKIYDISGNNASTAVNGLLISAGTTITAYNNIIGDLRATAANAANPVNGINVTGGTTANIYFNTVYLNATSTGALFGSSAISASTTPTLTLRNNIFVNASTSNGAGLTVAYRRSTATLTTYNAASNKNLFFAPNIFTDGTNTDVTLADYKTRVAARDAASISENPPFLSTTGSDATYLHINTTVATAIDGGADVISGITDDYDGDTRSTTVPDIGADEFLSVITCTGTPNAGVITTANVNKCVNQTQAINATGLSNGTGITYQWKVATVSGGPYVNVTGGTGANTASYTTGALTSGTFYYVLETTCTVSSQTNITNEFTLTVNNLPTVAVTPTSASFCSPSGSPVALTASGASTYAWSPAAGLSATTGASVTASPTGNTTYTVTGTDGNGCTNTATSVISVSASPVITSATALPTSVCSGGNTQLQVNVPTTVNAYTFSTGTGASLETITTPTVVTTVTTGNTDDGSNEITPTPGFTFAFEGVNYNGFSANTNGWLKMAATAPATNIPSSLTSLSQNGIYAFGHDANLNTANGGNLTHGPAAGGKYVFQFTNNSGASGGATSATSYITSQIVLWGSTSANPGRIDIIYGARLGTAGENGVIGIANAAGVYLNAVTGNSTATTTATSFPAAGTIYTFTPPTYTYLWSPSTFLNDATLANPIAVGVTANTTYTVQVSRNGCTTTSGNVPVTLATYNSATTTQPSTTAVTAGALDAQVLAIDIPQACAPENLTQLDFTNVSTLPADVANAKVYYTTTNTFATTNLFGSLANPGATFSVTGNQALSTTTRNYFWLVYDVACNAVNPNVIDAGLTSFTVGASNYTPTVTNPTGTRTITSLASLFATTQPSTTAVTNGSVNQQIVRISVPATACGALTNITFNTNGSTNAATDIAAARVYYTTTTTFATTTQFGTDVLLPNGSFNVVGSQTLSSTATNYFWLVYDVACNATATNVLDAEVNNVTIAGNIYAPTTVNPTGTRAITALYAPTKTDPNGTTAVFVGAVNAQFSRALIAGSAACPGTVTTVNFTATNATPTDIAKAKCYYTTTTTFSNATQFGTDIINPASGALSFTGSQLLATGNNYFWVVYDVDCFATVAASVNADITSLVVNSTTIPVTGTAAAANAIAAATSFTTVANGEWNNPATWACGNIPPTNATAVTIANAITVSNTGNIGGNVTINTGASLTINTGGELTLGTVGGGNRVLTNNGTLAVTGGVLNQNGSFIMNASSTFNQTGGDIFVDGNDGTAGGSVASTADIVGIYTSNLGVTDGNMTIVDPHFSGSAATDGGAAFAYEVATTSNAFGTNHTLIVGGNTNTNTSTATAGFYVDTYISSGMLKLGNVIINGGAAASRTVNTNVISGAGAINIGGNLTINTGSTLSDAIQGTSLAKTVTGNIINNGTFINRGTLILTTIAANSTTGIANTNPQTIGGTGVYANLATAATAEITSLTINNSSSIGVTLLTPIRISGTLSMIAGRINTDATNMLTLGFNASNTGSLSYTAGFINGPFKRWIGTTTGARVFPVGNTSLLKNASINYTTAPTAGGTLTARFSSVAPNFPNSTPLTEGALIVDYASAQGSWFVDAADGLAGGNYTAAFTGNGANDVVDLTGLVLIKRPSAGGDWVLDGTHVTATGTATAPVVSRTGMTGFSEFAIGGKFATVLPISIESFRGSKLASANYLDWKVTCTSEPSVRIILERGADGRNFTSIQDQVATAVRCLQGFNYTDVAPLAGANYYRLKVISLDGTFRYSSIVVLLNKEKGFELISLAPNPVKTTAVLTLTTTKGGKVDINVTDVTGKVVMKQSTTIIAGNNPINMNFSQLGAGSYQITAVNAEGEIRSTRFIKY
ncbi:T9SS type A sorting domain-containing protein [Ferruginibacter yonginensis]|uniref:T9SS type A sorting domain-containing protein n=1 Tax=Ferruginibacter yonginensis TaxID=1310416 RepID=A0ABV8QQV4_9BACT